MTVRESSPSDTDNSAAAAEGDTPKEPADTPKEVDHKAEAAKWKALARKHEDQAKSNADAAKELEELKEKDKSESQRQADATTAAEARAAKAEAENLRLKVALDKAPEGMPLGKVRKLATRLTGDTQEDLEADAEELFADFTSADTGGDKEKDDTTRRRPTERLKPGGAPDTEPEETDPIKLAEKVPPRY